MLVGGSGWLEARPLAGLVLVQLEGPWASPGRCHREPLCRVIADCRLPSVLSALSMPAGSPPPGATLALGLSAFLTSCHSS